MSRAIDELAALTADLRAHLEWEVMLGANVLPREKVDRTPGPPIRSGRPSRRAPQSPRVAPKNAPSRGSLPDAAPTPLAPAQAPEPPTPAPGPVELSSKWAKVMQRPSTHTLAGPLDARLVVIRGSGSSTEAETMLTKMLANVLGIDRGDALIVDIARDGRDFSAIGNGVRSALVGRSPSIVIVLGVHAAKAMFGEATVLGESRGSWHTLHWDGGSAPTRVSHHPEAILAMHGRGNSEARREAFDDLKAVRARLD
ncbi:MAG: uracil-DNA glycosylase family protein [Myxococcota bacterium]|nr:uracil-DNA glycosylase family protein [Myxococcota bacterium]